MTYEDEELAEAALLLSTTEVDRKMPASLQRAILDRGKVVASEVRFSTTKAAALAVDEAPDEHDARAVVRRPSFARRWGGWLAAAACFSIVVYQWRVHTLAEHARLAAAQAAHLIPVSDAAGVVVAEVAPRDALVTVRLLPANAPGERYELWLSPAGPDQAVAVGSFVCNGECRERPFALQRTLPLSPMKRAFITQNPTTEPAPVAPGLPAAARVVGEGSVVAR